jgi:hypothetical protein
MKYLNHKLPWTKTFVKIKFPYTECWWKCATNLANFTIVNKHDVHGVFLNLFCLSENKNSLSIIEVSHVVTYIWHQNLQQALFHVIYSVMYVVTTEGVWIGDSFYWPFIHSWLLTSLYRSLTHTQSPQSVTFFTGRFLGMNFSTGTITIRITGF